MPFSARTSQHDVPNALSRALAARTDVLDLTVANPTRAGIPYDPAILLALGDPRAMVYEPAALGLMHARAAVAAHHGVAVERVALTASTSEAYGALFKMLCDPGDEILVPAPSYPLLAWLAAFEGVRLVHYPLVHAGHWHVDLDALGRAITPRTRAIVVVSPNNPTGSYLGREELLAMLAHDLPIVSDEVFAPYPLALPSWRLPTLIGTGRGLVFSLSGLSKLAGLPQMKVGWIVASGAGERVLEAMDRLETVLDAYLSVGAPQQHALPEILARAPATTAAIRERTRTNLACVRAETSPCMTALSVEGGWYVVLRVPETMTEDEWVTSLVREDGVHVQPGYFFDMDRGAHLVVSLLTPEAVLAEGMARIAKRVG